MILMKRNYKIYNQKFLVIAIIFKYEYYYLKDNFYFVKILINYNNLKYFINLPNLNNC